MNTQHHPETFDSSDASPRSLTTAQQSSAASLYDSNARSDSHQHPNPHLRFYLQNPFHCQILSGRSKVKHYILMMAAVLFIAGVLSYVGTTISGRLPEQNIGFIDKREINFDEQMGKMRQSLRTKEINLDKQMGKMRQSLRTKEINLDKQMGKMRQSLRTVPKWVNNVSQ